MLLVKDVTLWGGRQVWSSGYQGNSGETKINILHCHFMHCESYMMSPTVHHDVPY